MFRVRLYLILALFARPHLDAQVLSALEDAVRIGPGVTPPRLLHKVEPEYSPDARADHIQGTVVLQLAVNEKGRPTGIGVISPLGFGLDERAQAAVETWEFVPGMKDGKSVKILAAVEVNFRFPELWFDEKAERQRTTFPAEISARDVFGWRLGDTGDAKHSTGLQWSAAARNRRHGSLRARASQGILR